VTIGVEIEASSSNQNLSSNAIESGNIEKSKPKVAISPQSKYVLTYSQTNKSFIGWNVSESLDIEKDIESQKSNIRNFKVSDNKVILYDDAGLGEILICCFQMVNKILRLKS